MTLNYIPLSWAKIKSSVGRVWSPGRSLSSPGLDSMTLLSQQPPVTVRVSVSWCVQVQSFLLHFWQGMPPHMLPVLGSPTVVNIVGVCDSILYKAISGVLMPTVLQALPDR